MKLAWATGIFCALVVHAAVLLFGGLLIPHKESHGTTQEVELISADDQQKAKPAEPVPEKKDEQIRTEEEPPPDAKEMMRNLEISAVAAAPALEAASLGEIEAALNGQGGAGDFSDALSFASGGRIGGMGKAGVADDKGSVFDLVEIDQKPRAIFQASPNYPPEMHGKKVDGVVSVIFVLDPTGKVTNPRAESSSHPAFEKPALDAVKQWKFEPALKGGQRVSCKMRVSIRFPHN